MNKKSRALQRHTEPSNPDALIGDPQSLEKLRSIEG
jgi:hypothetical protein